MKIRSTITIVLSGILALQISAQELPPQNKKRVDDYEWPTDRTVLKKLAQWRDLKFGVIFHWGLYTVPGILESWVLCGEDVDWITNFRRKELNYEEYKEWYWGLKDSLNPTSFNPGQWADIMKRAGMRYMIFTTKHHEGFCMYNTKQTDFSIMNGPFGKDPHADVAKYIFDTFRDQGFMVGAYFSKPDWHSEYYWWPFFPTRDRNVNYDIKQHPRRWQQFTQFTYRQIEEIMTGYGPIDILWLDGAQVLPHFFNQDIQMDRIAAMARKHQPGILLVDRMAKGPFENYQTPEGEIPPKQLNIPWETCLSMNGWGWRSEGEYKSSKKIISVLIEVVAKGGNLLLGIGPTAEGLIDNIVAERVLTIGKWLEKNGKAIYGTVATKHYNDGNVWFTCDKNQRSMYACYALDDDEKKVPDVIEWTENIPQNNYVTLLQTQERIRCQVEGNRVKIFLPKYVDRSQSLAFVFDVKE